MPDLVPVRRALLSVSDKTDLTPFARALAGHGVEIVSTGGTARKLQEAGLEVTPVEDVTGFPEMLDGRVKTLHPAVHGGLLALRDNKDHAGAIAGHGIAPIDLVCVNLYPFERTVSDPGVDQDEAIEQIDIGGPAMIRSGAKNLQWVTVVTSPAQYDRVINDMNANEGATSLRLRSELAAAAFGRTSEYDAAIASFLSRRAPGAFPEVLQLRHTKAVELRYGENPHQEAALYRDPASTGPTIVNAQQRSPASTKPLSYNNILDAAAALELVKTLRRMEPDAAGACIVKHTNPCGAAVAPTPAKAAELALAGDPLAAYGGILALNRDLDAGTASFLVDKAGFLEVIIAPEFAPGCADTLRGKWKDVRLLAVGERAGSATRKLEYRSIPGGMLVQDRDVRLPATDQWRHAAGPAPDGRTLRVAAFLVATVRALSSNAVAVGAPDGDGWRLLGAGAGQMDRVSSCRLAVQKAGRAARGSVAAGDAFFPFPDGPEVLIDAGVKTIVHPGGSKRDQETLDLCEKRGVTCLLTGVRHFRH